VIYFFALLAAGGFEVVGVAMMNAFSRALTARAKTLYVVALAVNFALSLSALGYAMKGFPMSVAYAIWTGIGAVGAVAIDVFVNHAKLGRAKAFFLFLIIFSAIMLKLI
jgi:paired small multidrug resistance pump